MWNLSHLQKQVLRGARCGYCRRETNLSADRLHVECRPCSAYVTLNYKGIPNGRVAKPELRKLRQKAHRAFDPIWQGGEMSRPEAYAWLSGAMGIPFEWCHIAMLSEISCLRVVAVCEEKLLCQI